jgi:hypothetical protein
MRRAGLRKICRDLFVRHAEAEVRAFAVFQAEHRLAHHGPAARLLPHRRGVERGQKEFLTADGLHLLADDPHDALRDALRERQQGVNPRAQLADVARAQEQAVRDDLGVSRVVAERRNKEL